MKISTKLICTIEIMMLLVIIISSFAAFQLGNRIIGEQVNKQLESVIILKTNQLNSYFNERIGDIDSLSSSEDITGLLPSENADRFQDREVNLTLTDEKRAALQDRLNRYGNFVNFIIMEKNGEVYLSTDKSQEGMLRTNSEYFIEGKKGLYADNLNYDLRKSRPTMMISAPILDDEGELRAVLAGEVNLTSMSALMTERGGLGETGETYLVNNYNFVLTQLRKDTATDYDNKKFIYTRAVEDCLDEKPTAISPTQEYTDYSGDTVVGLYKYLPEMGTAIIAKIDTEEAYAYSEALWNTIFVITCVIAAISLLIALLISRTISKPITKLTKGAEIIGRGNLDHIIEVKTKDEVGELAAAFNKMTANLKETTASRDELNKEVDERKRAEGLLRNAEADWRNSFNSLEDVMLIIDRDYNVENINESGLKLLGKGKEEVIGKKCYQVISGVDSPVEYCPCTKSMKTKKVESLDRYEERFNKYFSIQTSPIFDDNGEIIKFVDLRRDITERKRAEEVLEAQKDELEKRTKELAEERDYIRHLIESSPDFQMTLDKDGKIMDVNEEFEKMVGKGRKELIGTTIYEYLPKEVTEKAIAEIFEKGKVRNIELTADIPGKEALICNFSGTVFTMPEGKTAIYATGRDITEHKLAETRVKTSLKEKEVLLREIHHRVKNNLQIISSLLNMQAMNAKDKRVVESLLESRSRIHMMALIHAQLYQSENLARVEMGTTIRKLVNFLLQIYAETKKKIKPVVTAEGITLPISQAIPCGLIINELVSNTLKHAFTGMKEGSIEISMRELTGGSIKLTVKDNGVGIPEELDIYKIDTLGLKIVRTLAEEQLKGKMGLILDKGAEIYVEFDKLIGGR